MNPAIFSVLVAACLSGCVQMQTPLPVAPVLFTSRGVSMLPTIHRGQILHVEPCRFEDLQPGQIVTYRNYFFRGEGTLTHRLVRKTAAGWVTKGDNNAHEDTGLCTRETFVGVVARITEG